METFYSHGKLLISSEYAVIDGAQALALPTKFGQTLNVESISGCIIHWKSISNTGKTWFETQFSVDTKLKISCNNNSEIALRLLQVLKILQLLNPTLFKTNQGFKLTSTLEFPVNWGLGSSSTLINNLSQWAKVDAFKLLDLTFGGSGYDIACAQNNTAILYQLSVGIPLISPVSFVPVFSSSLFFIHRNQKQNSRDGIAAYKESTKHKIVDYNKLNSLTLKLLNCHDLETFKNYIGTHEEYIGSLLQQQPLKEALFSDYDGAIKSLGAWGGDFFLATGNSNSINYFRTKGYTTIIPFSEMIL
jgi:mevalonate kinase